MLFARSLLLFFCVMLSACVTQSLTIRPNEQPVYYKDRLVETSPLQIYVQPSHAPNVPPTALFIPFRVTQRMDDAVLIGEGISKQVWGTWLSEAVFPVIEWATMPVPYREDMALALAKARGADYVIGGVISYLLDGGSVDTSSISMQIDIHHAASGTLLWSMAQSALIRKVDYEDYILFAVKHRMPTDPLALVVQTIATNMAKAIKGEAHSGSESGYPDKDSF